MSKTSTKSKYEQLMQWIPTLGRVKEEKVKETSKFSKADHYKKQGAYGKASN